MLKLALYPTASEILTRRSGVYVESDPAGLFGGINGYGYVNASPVSESDPLGLWGTEAHNTIIQTAFPSLDYMLQQALE